LICKGVLSNDDDQWIQTETTQSKAAERLLKILRRKSQSAFDKFIEALFETRQQHVAYPLLNKTVDGDVVLDYEENEAEETITSVEKRIIQESVIMEIDSRNL
jgi:Holliday junction resolvasome RuvABC DNA-binding subunit